MQTDHYRASHTVVLRHDQREVDMEALKRAMTHAHDTVDSLPDARRYMVYHHHYVVGVSDSLHRLDQEQELGV